MANAIGARLHALFRTTTRDPLRVLLQAVRSETEARNDRAFAAKPVDCRAGCAYCCHQQVTATAPEILLLAERIQEEKPPVRARLRAAVQQAAGRTQGLDSVQRWIQRERCPLLGTDGLCRFYEHRPLACRGYASFDVGACRAVAADPADRLPSSVPHPRDARTNAIMMSYALERALAAAGLAHRMHDLNQGLAIALEIGPRRAIAAYLEGKDVLAAARIGPAPISPPSAGEMRNRPP